MIDQVIEEIESPRFQRYLASVSQKPKALRVDEKSVKSETHFLCRKLPRAGNRRWLRRTAKARKNL